MGIISIKIKLEGMKIYSAIETPISVCFSKSQMKFTPLICQIKHPSFSMLLSSPFFPSIIHLRLSLPLVSLCLRRCKS